MKSFFNKTSHAPSFSKSIEYNQVISFYFKSLVKTALSTLVSLNPITVTFASLAI